MQIEVFSVIPKPLILILHCYTFIYDTFDHYFHTVKAYNMECLKIDIIIVY